jgi:hypothetical protein
MKSIHIDDINFELLKKIYCVRHMESDVYFHGDTFYKFFNTMDERKLKVFDKKVELLHELDPIDHVVLPEKKIVNDKYFLGFTSVYIPETEPLENRILTPEELDRVMENVSRTLKEIHDRDIICGDCNAGNIILYKSNNHYFIDSNGFIINGITCCAVPCITKNYLITTKNWGYAPTQNNDRLTIFLEYCYKIFSNPIQNVDDYDIDRESEKHELLNKSKTLIKKLKKEDDKIPTVPYLYEL